jgi:hypothetical protein
MFRKCACGAGASGLSGKCEECSKKKFQGLQTKLQVNDPGDAYEQEADRVADQVLAKPAHPHVSNAPPRIQRFSGQASGHSEPAPESVNTVLASSGRPLDRGSRQDMEQRFGQDFSAVRVHVGTAAEQSARDVNAAAYTVGNNIVFGAGQFAPQTSAGRRLIAHELTHVVQQSGSRRVSLQRKLLRGAAAGCGICLNDAGGGSLAGRIAHCEVQDAFIAANPDMVAERPVPMTEATPSMPDDDISCVFPGGVPLWPQVDLSYERMEHGQRVIYIGEIKPLDDAGKQVGAGRKQLQDYERAFRASGRYDEVYRMRDKPPSGPLYFVNPRRPPSCPPQLIQVAQTERGLYQYYCVPPFSEQVKDARCKCPKDDDEKEKDQPKQQQKELNLPLIVATGAALTAAVIGTSRYFRPKVPTPKPIVRPHVPVVAPKPGGTVTPIRQPKPFSPGRPAAPHHRPATGGRSGGRAGRIAGGIGMAAGFALIAYEVYSLLGSFDDAKEQLAAINAYREQFWKEYDEEMARQKKAAKDAPPTQVVTAPPVQPAKQPDPPPKKPVEKTVKIPVYSLSRTLKLTQSEIEVPSSALGVLYEKVTFWTLTPPGKFTTAIERSQVDCSKVDAGAAAASGWQQLTGYASPEEAKLLNGVLSTQVALVRLMCAASGQTPKPAGQPDSDEVTAVINTIEGTVTATCKKVGGANFSCSKDGDFESLKQLTEEPLSNERDQFDLEVTLVRVRGGNSQRFDRYVGASLEDPDDLLADPDVTKEGSIPADAVDPTQYPADSALAYILSKYYSPWDG